MSSECCSFDLGCLSKPSPTEAEAHQVCEWLSSCPVEQAHRFCRENVHRLASLVASTSNNVVRDACLRILHRLALKIASQASMAPYTCDLHSLAAAVMTLTAFAKMSLRSLRVESAVALVRTMGIACALLPPPESCVCRNSSTEDGLCVVSQSIQEQSQMWLSDSDGHTASQCHLCCMLDLAVAHLSSRHEALANASQDLLTVVVQCLGSFAAPMNVLQKQVQTTSQQCLSLDGVPPCIAQWVRTSMAESVLLKMLRCVQSIVSAAQDVPALMSGGVMVDSLHLSYFVLQNECQPTEGHHLSTSHPAQQLLPHSSSFLRPNTWTALLITDPPFQPSKALARAASTLIKSVASSSTVWCEMNESPTRIIHPVRHAVACATSVQSQHPDCRLKARVGAAGQASLSSCATDSGSHAVEGMEAVIERENAVPRGIRNDMHAVSCVLLQMVRGASKEPTLQAHAMQCAAGALRNGCVGVDEGAVLLQAGAESVRSALQATEGAPVDASACADDTLQRCAGHVVSASGAFVLAAAKWIREQLRHAESQPRLRGLVRQLSSAAIWPAIELISSSDPLHAAVCNATAPTCQADRRSTAVHVSIAVLESISTCADLVLDGAEGAKKLEEAAAQCVVHIQSALAGLPSGHMTTALYVRAMVCMLDSAYVLYQHAQTSSVSQCSFETLGQGMLDERGPPLALWCTLSESCLRKLITPHNISTSMHVLSPILCRILHFRQEPGPHTEGLDQLLATRIELLECLDFQYSAQVLCEEASEQLQGVPENRLDTTCDFRFVYGQVVGDVDGKPSVSNREMVWKCKVNGDILLSDQQTVNDSTDVVWTIADLLGSAARTGVSGTVIMHVKEILSSYKRR